MRLEKKINLCYANDGQESSIGYPASAQFRGDGAEGRVWLPKKGDAYATLFRAPEDDLPSMAFPSTRFYGSKRRQLSWLQTELSRIQGRTALDAFGGTGAVSYLLGKLGFQTTYNDIFEFNTISARAIFSKSALSFNELSLRKLLEAVTPTDGFISEAFHDLYFTQEENRWLDAPRYTQVLALARSRNLPIVFAAM